MQELAARLRPQPMGAIFSRRSDEASARMPAMNVALRQPMTLEEFLNWEERQELRYEFDGLQPVAMTGGSFEHDAIQVNLLSALKNRLAGKSCRPHGSNLKVEVMGSIRYPDVYVTCGPIERGGTVARDPVVIFEVLSKGTAAKDRGVKNREYASTASVQRYVMLEQVEVGGTMFEREGHDWVGHILTAGFVIRMPEIGIEIPLVELYDGIDLANPPADEIS